MFSEDEVYDPDVDVAEYSQRALTLYERYCTCYTLDHVDSVIQDQLDRLQANKISIHGNLYFIPNPYLQKLNMLEDYIDAISQYNLGGGLVMSNSMFVVDDDRQRQKMTEEFYINYKRDIEQYKERIQHFIDNGCTSPTVYQSMAAEAQGASGKGKNTYERDSETETRRSQQRLCHAPDAVRRTPCTEPSGANEAGCLTHKIPCGSS